MKNWKTFGKGYRTAALGIIVIASGILHFLQQPDLVDVLVRFLQLFDVQASADFLESLRQVLMGVLILILRYNTDTRIGQS